jgi:tRNA-splicing ligase RtcB
MDHHLGLTRVGDVLWEMPAAAPMRVPGRVFADSELMDSLRQDQSLEQVRNVACLPGILRYSLAMPDIHYGYGFPIGGVAAFSVEDGVVSPGGVGYDINCGVRLMSTRLTREDVGGRIAPMVDQLFRDVPAGVGSAGAIAKLSRAELEKVLARGAAWAVDKGYGRAADLEHTEDGGTLPGADPDAVSDRAYARGLDQVGTLGSGNHFLEIQVVEEVFDPTAARASNRARSR